MSETNKSSDIEIFKRLKSGNTQAFEIIYQKYWQRLFDQAYRRTGDEELVKEIIQDLFTELWQNKHRIEIHSSLASYLQQSLKYKLYNHYKSKQVQERYTQFVSQRTSIDFLGDNQIEKQVNYSDLSNALKRCIEKLPKQAKCVYKLQQDEGLSYSEIAAHLHISVSTVEKHIIKALKTIREELKYFILAFFLLF